MSSLVVAVDSSEIEISTEESNQIVISTDSTELTLGTPTTGAGVSSIVNIGAGANVFSSTVGGQAQLRTLSGTGGISCAVNGDVVEIDGSGISVSPAGSDTYIQFNDGGSAFGADAFMRYDDGSNQILFGDTASAADFPNARVVVSQADSLFSEAVAGPVNLGLFAEAVAAARPASGLYGVSLVSSTTQGAGVTGVARVETSTNSGPAVGGSFLAMDPHTGGNNVAAVLFATGGAENYALQIVGGDVQSTIDNQWLIGANAEAANFPNARVIVSEADSGFSDGGTQNFGLVGEAVTSGGRVGTGLTGYAKGSGAIGALGIAGGVTPGNAADTGTLYAVAGDAYGAHAGANVSLSAFAANAAENYAIQILAGDIQSLSPLDWIMRDNDANALDFIAGVGGASLLTFDTTTGSEQVRIGDTADAADFPNARVIVSHSDTGYTIPSGGNVGLIGEASGVDGGGGGSGVYGVGAPSLSGAVTGVGVTGIGQVRDTNDAADAVAALFLAAGTHVGGDNTALRLVANNGAQNNAVEILAGDVRALVDNQWLIGANADPADFPNARMIVSQADTGQTDAATYPNARAAIVTEAVADPSDPAFGFGLHSIAKTNGNGPCIAVLAEGIVSASADTATAYGIAAQVADAHASGNNVAALLVAANGAENYALQIAAGDVNALVDNQWLIGADASAADFPGARAIFSHSDTGATGTSPARVIGVVGEAKATGSESAYGLAGYGSTLANLNGIGVFAKGLVDDPTDSSVAQAIQAICNDTHTGGSNNAMTIWAANSTVENNAIVIIDGDIKSLSPLDWIMRDNDANALDFIAGVGGASLLTFDTTNSAERVLFGADVDLGSNQLKAVADGVAGTDGVNLAQVQGLIAASDTLQEVYENSTQPQIVLTAAQGGLQIQDAATPIGAPLFEVQSNGGTTAYLSVGSGGACVGATKQLYWNGRAVMSSSADGILELTNSAQTQGIRFDTTTANHLGLTDESGNEATLSVENFELSPSPGLANAPKFVYTGTATMRMTTGGAMRWQSSNSNFLFATPVKLYTYSDTIEFGSQSGGTLIGGSADGLFEITNSAATQGIRLDLTADGVLALTDESGGDLSVTADRFYGGTQDFFGDNTLTFGGSVAYVKTINRASTTATTTLQVTSGAQTNVGDYDSGDLWLMTGDTTTAGEPGDIYLKTGTPGSGAAIDRGQIFVQSHGGTVKLAQFGQASATNSQGNVLGYNGNEGRLWWQQANYLGLGRSCSISWSDGTHSGAGMGTGTSLWRDSSTGGILYLGNLAQTQGVKLDTATTDAELALTDESGGALTTRSNYFAVGTGAAGIGEGATNQLQIKVGPSPSTAATWNTNGMFMTNGGWFIGWNSSTKMNAPADGNLRIENAAATQGIILDTATTDGILNVTDESGTKAIVQSAGGYWFTGTDRRLDWNVEANKLRLSSSTQLTWANGANLAGSSSDTEIRRSAAGALAIGNAGMSQGVRFDTTTDNKLRLTDESATTGGAFYLLFGTNDTGLGTTGSPNNYLIFERNGVNMMYLASSGLIMQTNGDGFSANGVGGFLSFDDTGFLNCTSSFRLAGDGTPTDGRMILSNVAQTQGIRFDTMTDSRLVIADEAGGPANVHAYGGFYPNANTSLTATWLTFNLTSPSGVKSFDQTGTTASREMWFRSGNQSNVGAYDSGDTYLASGNSTGGDSGGVYVRTGTAGGTAGAIYLQTAGTTTQLKVRNDGYLELIELGAEATGITSGYGALYAKTDGKIYYKAHDGSETDLTSGGGGGGDVYLSGTPVDNQIAVWTNSTTIEGDADLTYDGSALQIGASDTFKWNGKNILGSSADNLIEITNSAGQGIRLDLTTNGKVILSDEAGGDGDLEVSGWVWTRDTIDGAITSDGGCKVGSAKPFFWSGRSYLYSSADGLMELQNAAGTQGIRFDTTTDSMLKIQDEGGTIADIMGRIIYFGGATSYYLATSGIQWALTGGGTVTLETDAYGGTAASGSMAIRTGDQTNAGDYASGDIDISTGDTTTDGKVGDINILTGVPGAGAADGGVINFGTIGGADWQINTSGNLADQGTHSVYIGGSARVGATKQLYWNGRAVMSSSADGILELTNSAATQGVRFNTTVADTLTLTDESANALTVVANRFDGYATGLRETSGPTDLAMGAVSDGQYLVRSGSTIIGAAGGGGVTASGTPVDGQIAIWTSDSDIEGDANFTWDGSAFTQTLARSTTGDLTLHLNHTGTTSTDDSIVHIQTYGTGGDAVVRYTIGATGYYAAADNSDNLFKIGQGSAVGSNIGLSLNNSSTPDVTITNSLFIGAGVSKITSSSDGLFELTNNAGTQGIRFDTSTDSVLTITDESGANASVQLGVLDDSTAVYIAGPAQTGTAASASLSIFTGTQSNAGDYRSGNLVLGTGGCVADGVPGDIIFRGGNAPNTAHASDIIFQTDYNDTIFTIDGSLQLGIFAYGMRVGNTSDTTDGNIRWDGSNYQGYKTGTGWVNLDSSGGGAGISGTPSDSQIAVWTGATDIEGDSDFTYDGSAFQVGSSDTMQWASRAELASPSDGDLILANAAGSQGIKFDTSTQANVLLLQDESGNDAWVKLGSTGGYMMGNYASITQASSQLYGLNISYTNSYMGGAVNLYSNATSGATATGNVTLYTGQQSNAGNYASGSISIYTGDTTTDGDVGDITLKTGAAGAGAADAGWIYFQTHGSNTRMAIRGDGYMELVELSSEATSITSGFGALYAKTDGKVYYKAHDGSETDLTGGGGTHRQEAVTTQTITGTDTALTDTLNYTPSDANSLMLFLNGVFQVQGTGKDYSISGTTITWLANTGTAVDMATSDVLVAVYVS